MKVAIVTQGYPGGGGVPTIVTWLRQGLKSLGHEAHVHNLAASVFDSQSRRLLVPSTWIKSLTPLAAAGEGIFHWGANWVEFEGQRYRPRRALTRALDGYDLVQVVSGGPAIALSVADVRAPKALQVATSLEVERRAQLHGMPVVKRLVKTASLRRLLTLERKALRAVDVVLVENRVMQTWVMGQGQPNIVFAPPGIDTDLYQPPDNWDASRPILAFGRLADPRKDWPTAVAAYEHAVVSAGLANGLVLAGRGPVPEALSIRVARSPLRDRIAVLEDVTADDLPGLMAASSVFLQSSLEEGLGLAGLEAMACGLPVVATRTAGSSEYVRSGENGVLVDLGPGAAVALGRGLVSVLQDGDRGRALSACARRTCEEGYSSATALGLFVSTYKNLVEVGRPAVTGGRGPMGRIRGRQGVRGNAD